MSGKREYGLVGHACKVRHFFALALGAKILGKNGKSELEPLHHSKRNGPNWARMMAFGWSNPEEDALWIAMSEEQRKTAFRRLTALLKVERELRPITTEDAAAETGLSLNRWYELHAAWREKRSLSSLGILGDKPRRRVLDNHNDLQRLVVPVVDADPEGSIRQLSFALGEAYAPVLEAAKVNGAIKPEKKGPSENTLRRFVAAELRRRAVEMQPGNEVMFDCTACELPHAGGIFVVFMILDKGSRAVLGAALGDANRSYAGYALAAKDAMDRIMRAPLSELDWAEKLARSELVFGLDEHAWSSHVEQMKRLGMRNHLKPVTRAKRFGAYVRPLLGLRMGRVKFLPGKVSKELVVAPPTPDDIARLGVEIDIHNEARVADRREVVKDKPTAPPSEPPGPLITLLKRVTKG